LHLSCKKEHVLAFAQITLCNNTVQNRISNCTPQTQVRITAGTVLFALWGRIFPFATLLIKHSLWRPIPFNARFCINHNFVLVVRVIGLLFAREMAILFFLHCPSNFDLMALQN
jgi:hypothetical protein